MRLLLTSVPGLLQLPDLTHLGAQVPVQRLRRPAGAGAGRLAALPRPAVHVTLGRQPAFWRPDRLQALVDAADVVAVLEREVQRHDLAT